MKKEDLANLEVVFTFARQAVVANEKELINLINFKGQLFEKLNKLIEEDEAVDVKSKKDTVSSKN